MVGCLVVFLCFDSNFDVLKNVCFGVLLGSFFVFVEWNDGCLRLILWCVIKCIFVYNKCDVFFLFCVIFLNFLGKKLSVFVFNVFNVVCVLWCVSEENIRIGVGCLFIMVFIVEMLFMIGILIFIVIIFGLSVFVFLSVLCLFFVFLIILSFLLLLSIFFIWWW